MGGSRIRDRLRSQETDGVVGRDAEIEALSDILRQDGPLAVQLHGISGIGKTSLVRQFARTARAQGSTVIELDGRDVEPTETGFLSALQGAIGGDCHDVASATDRIQTLGGRVVLVIDTYEVLRLLDTWLRRVFVPALPDNARLVLSGRAPPVAGWLTDPGWHGVFRGVELAPLGNDEAVALLRTLGLAQKDARQLNTVTRGHPLALRLGASVFRESFDLARAADRVIDTLTRAFLDTLTEENLRAAVETASIPRRITFSMLSALLPEHAPEDIFARLRDLPFVDARRDGLVMHDAVREVLSSNLRASDPVRYRSLRHAAWRQLNADLEAVGGHDLWRYTADMLYLTENPVIREAFFPSDHQPLAVEPAMPEHRDTILAIATDREGPESAAHLDIWWDTAPDGFKVVKDQSGSVAGFYCCFEAGAATARVLQNDPVSARLMQNLSENPLARGQEALILRKWLSATDGEAPSPVQAACWLDIKRTYIEKRHSLRRVYTSAWDVAQYQDVLPVLGFEFFSNGVMVDDNHHLTSVVDFGPGLVLGWMSGIVGAELGLKSPQLLDCDAHELVIDGRRVSLTGLEFKVIRHMSERAGQVVSRDDLLNDVWGVTHDSSSNVVDAVIRSLRRKLGPLQSAVETVRGVGYRFIQPDLH